MARPKKNIVDASEIVKKATQGLNQMDAERDNNDPYGFEAWMRVGQAKEIFRQILDACNAVEIVEAEE